jgi:general secretion pathway protein G
MRHFNYSTVLRSAELPNAREGSPEPWRRRIARSVGGVMNDGGEGFTLIELLVVLALIVILASVGLAQYKNSVIYSKQAVLKDDLFKLNEAIDQYYADKGQYPSSLESLVTDGYIRAIPVDPFTNSASSWQTVLGGTGPQQSHGPGRHYAAERVDGTRWTAPSTYDWKYVPRVDPQRQHDPVPLQTDCPENSRHRKTLSLFRTVYHEVTAARVHEEHRSIKAAFSVSS